MITKTLAERLRMMYIEMRSKNPGGVEGFDTPLFFEAIAQAEGEKAGELSDEEIERLCQSAFPVPDPAASMPSDSRMASAHWGMSNGLKVARDNDYLRPSQAIGEPAKEAPYGIKELQLLPGYFWVTFRGKPVIQGRADQPCDSFPEGQALRIRTALNNAYAQSPISTEARDMAIEAGSAMAGLISRKTGMSTMQPTQSEWEHSLQAWDQALSALRGE